MNKNFLLRLIAGAVLIFGGFFLTMLFSVWCFNWLLEAFQTIINNPLIELSMIDKSPLVLFLGLVVLGVTLLLLGVGILLGAKRHSA